MPNPCTASAETLAAKRQIKESILKEYRSPLARQDYAEALIPLSLDELKLALDSVKVRQRFFASKELATLYGSSAKELLARYFSLYAADGFSEHVAIDDCDTAQFAAAIIGTDSPTPSKVSGAVTPGDDCRPDPLIVLNSCRKYQGVKLDTCVSNGSAS